MLAAAGVGAGLLVRLPSDARGGLLLAPPKEKGRAATFSPLPVLASPLLPEPVLRGLSLPYKLSGSLPYPVGGAGATAGGCPLPVRETRGSGSGRALLAGQPPLGGCRPGGAAGLAMLPLLARVPLAGPGPSSSGVVGEVVGVLAASAISELGATPLAA